jgi:hypothetical protein
VQCQPWFYLRLFAYGFFWLSEGAYGFSRDSLPKAAVPPNGITDTHPRTRAPERTDRPPPEMNPGMDRPFTDAQAACGFRYSASKRTPFFQTSKVIAAILRARVRRAIDGFIPLATKAA